MLSEGSERFRRSRGQAASDEEATRLFELADWADGLAASGLCRVWSKQQQNPALHLKLLKKDQNLAIVFNWGGVIHMTLYRDTLASHAGNALSTLEAITGWDGKRHIDVREFTPELLDAIEAAYREAAGEGA